MLKFQIDPDINQFLDAIRSVTVPINMGSTINWITPIHKLTIILPEFIFFRFANKRLISSCLSVNYPCHRIVSYSIVLYKFDVTTTVRNLTTDYTERVSYRTVYSNLFLDLFLLLLLQKLMMDSHYLYNMVPYVSINNYFIHDLLHYIHTELDTIV